MRTQIEKLIEQKKNKKGKVFLRLGPIIM